MLPVGLALLEREPVRPREAPWPRWGCDRRWGARCSGTCDCPRFGGLTHPDDCRCVRRHHHHWLQRSERAGSDRV